MHWSRRKLQILIAILAAVLISLSGVAEVMAKYTNKTEINGQLTLTANIGQIGVWEIPVEYGLTTGYQKAGENYVHKDGETYSIIPGLDIPKDTVVMIKEKDPAPVYVYLKVHRNFTSNSNGISYSINTNDWVYLKTETVDGLDVDVYYYKTIVDDQTFSNGEGTIKILSDDYIHISQNVYQNISGEIDEFQLKFTATMRQVISGKTAAEIYGSTGY